tara:strand:- start:312 stop:1364 length:1053 start_codon:yes stop_codon:yes gene_type:complete
MSGEKNKLGQSIIKSTRLALKDIGTNNMEIYPRDTGLDPNKTLQSAIELKKLGVKIIIGPVFFENIKYLSEVKDIIFLSLTNKTNGLPNNVISSGVNSVSQLNAIKKFTELNELKKTILLIPDLNYKTEINRAIKKTKLKISKRYIYNIEPTKLTQQIEEITNYKIRKQNLADEIKRVELSNVNEEIKKKRIEKLNKRYTIGNVDFDSLIISDFNESLKSVITSFLYTDIYPQDKYFITLNQWFDESLLSEKNIQPLYYPSINKKNLEDFTVKFTVSYNEKPNHLSLLSYDLVGLIYYLTLKNDLSDTKLLFKKKSSFKGKIGVFDIKDNKINHRLNFYQIENGSFKKIF